MRFFFSFILDFNHMKLCTWSKPFSVQNCVPWEFYTQAFNTQSFKVGFWRWHFHVFKSVGLLSYCQRAFSFNDVHTLFIKIQCTLKFCRSMHMIMVHQKNFFLLKSKSGYNIFVIVSLQFCCSCTVRYWHLQVVCYQVLQFV